MTVSKPLLAAFCTAFFANSGLALAQDVQPDSDTAEEASAPSSPSVITERFSDWTYRCVDVAIPVAADEALDTDNAVAAQDGDQTLQAAETSTVRQCEVALVAQVETNGEINTVLTLAIAPTAPSSEGGESELLLTGLVPLNVFLPANLVLGADERDVTEIAYRNCNQAGCWAQMRLDDAITSAFRGGNTGFARMRLMNGQNVTVNFSLTGITAALNRLAEGQAE